MTGYYHFWKGKLKVGDRVKDHFGILGTVTFVDDEGFDFKSDAGGYHWRPWNTAESKCTLELLESPGPHENTRWVDGNAPSEAEPGSPYGWAKADAPIPPRPTVGEIITKLSRLSSDTEVLKLHVSREGFEIWF